MGSPLPATTFIPEWFKSIPPSRINPGLGSFITGRESGTVKSCTPFLDAFTFGYIASVPHDIGIGIENGKTVPYWSYNRKNKAMYSDLDFRTDGLVVPDGYDKTVWRVNIDSVMSVPKGYSVLITHPLNRFDLPFLSLSGVIDADKFNGSLVANIYLKTGFTGIIETGTPILQLIPFKRENWEKETLEFDENIGEIQNFQLFSKINRSYKNKFWSKKTYR